MHTKNISKSQIREKMVDYAISLKANLIEFMFKRIINIMQLELPDPQYINHTAFELMRFWPIAVSIELKVKSNNKAKATT